MKLVLLAAAGGAIGASLRLLVNEAFVVRGLVAFPWATLTVNVAGSFLMGVIVTLVAERWDGSPELRTFLATGILGGLTTFSAFSLEVFQLASQEAGAGRAALYVLLSVALGLAGLVAGIAAARGALA